MPDTTSHPPQVRGTLETVWPAEAQLGEGLCWSVQRQALYWVDILEKRLYRYTPATGHKEQWDFEDTISAVAERESAPGLVVTLRRGFAFFDPDADGGRGRIERLHEPEPERIDNRFNDGKCDAQGRFWGGTMAIDCKARTGALYRFGANGNCTRMLDDGFPVTNGPTWSLDGRTMYVNDTARARIHAFDFDPESGTISNQRLWLRFAQGEGYPDGMTTDAAGRLWIAHWGGCRVTCRDPESARELLRIDLPVSQVSNVCFGGVGLNTLYITSASTELSAEQLQDEPLAGALLCIETDATGLPANAFAG